MASILEEFAYGNVRPGAQDFGRGPAVEEAARAVLTGGKALLGRLEGEERALFERQEAAQRELGELIAVKNMVFGFKLGLLMTAEAFLGMGELYRGGNG